MHQRIQDAPRRLLEFPGKSRTYIKKPKKFPGKSRKLPGGGRFLPRGTKLPKKLPTSIPGYWRTLPGPPPTIFAIISPNVLEGLKTDNLQFPKIDLSVNRDLFEIRARDMARALAENQKQSICHKFALKMPYKAL